MASRETQPYRETKRSEEGFAKPHDFILVIHEGVKDKGLIVEYTTVFDGVHDRLAVRVIYYHEFKQYDKGMTLEFARQNCRTLDDKEIKFLFKVKRSLEGEAHGEIQDDWYYDGARTAPDGTEEIILTKISTDSSGKTLQRFTPISKVILDNDIYRKKA